jgi:hypothetical protein
MSLVRLLTAGKSLVGIQDSKSRYRSVDPRVMPKFGSEKKTNADVARESEIKPSVAKSNLESSKADVAATPVATARKARGSGWVSQWGSKLSSLVSQKPKPAKSGIPRLNGVPVQGELSLDNIKVVRNDLSDADLEVVTRKMAPAKKAESESQEWAPVKNVTPTFVSANSGALADRNVGVSAVNP